jgi:hypothetical protein
MQLLGPASSFLLNQQILFVVQKCMLKYLAYEAFSILFVSFYLIFHLWRKGANKGRKKEMRQR